MDIKWTSKLKRIFIGGIIRQIIVITILSIIGIIALSRLISIDKQYLKFKDKLSLDYLITLSVDLDEEIGKYTEGFNDLVNGKITTEAFQKHSLKNNRRFYAIGGNNCISYLCIDNDTKKMYINTKDYYFAENGLRDDLSKTSNIEEYIKRNALAYYKVDNKNTLSPTEVIETKENPYHAKYYWQRFERFTEYYWMDKRNWQNQENFYILYNNMYTAWGELLYVIFCIFILAIFIIHLRKQGFERIKFNVKNEVQLWKFKYYKNFIHITEKMYKIINLMIRKFTISNIKLRCVLILIIAIILPTILSEVIYSRRLSILGVLNAFEFFIKNVLTHYSIGDFFIVYLVIIFLYIMKKMNYFEYILKSANKIAEGDFSIELNEKGDKDLSKLAHNINAIKYDYQNAIEERIKDERLKSEIVLNVSNNLKLPVNSIESYISLYQNENTFAKEKEEYLNIIYDKAKKLKTLIENLFEVSKLNSGKVELNKEDIDIMELIYQVIGESLDNYSEKNIRFIVNSFSEEIIINVDGKKISRLIEELISNALEHSLANTRIYIDVEKMDDKMLLSIKNVANYVVEADEEIPAKASKFGIIIASGIAEIHGGSMKIEREGDLFKVYLLLSLKK